MEKYRPAAIGTLVTAPWTGRPLLEGDADIDEVERVMD